MSSRERLKVVPTVGIWVMRDGNDGRREVLLHLRQNTGFGDGTWDPPSGHIEYDANGMIETPKAACVRELREESCLEVKEEDLQFIGIGLCTQPEVNYEYITFAVEWDGSKPAIGEPQKCAELGWFPVDELPEGAIFITRHLMSAHLASPDKPVFPSFSLPQ